MNPFLYIPRSFIYLLYLTVLLKKAYKKIPKSTYKLSIRIFYLNSILIIKLNNQLKIRS